MKYFSKIPTNFINKIPGFISFDCSILNCLILEWNLMKLGMSVSSASKALYIKGEQKPKDSFHSLNSINCGIEVGKLIWNRYSDFILEGISYVV